MFKVILVVISITLAGFGCSEIRKIEEKDSNGVVVERYSINKTTEEKVGKYNQWYPGNNQIKTDINYVDGKKHGVEKRWFEDGQLYRVRTFVNGEINGKCVGYYENGNKEFEYTKRTVEIKRRTPARTHFSRSNAYDGYYFEGYRNGKKKVECTYKNNRIDGQYTEWYESGTRKENGLWRDGHKQGKWVQWYRNGRLKAEAIYLDGQLKGRVSRWDRNGKRI